MSIINKGRTFSNGEQLTAEKLNVLIDEASFNSSTAVDNSTTRVSASGAITVRPQGITSTELASSAVTTAKIADATGTSDGVTFAKIRQLENMKTIGNVSGSTAAPTQVDILDEDDMSSDSATSLATQQSIKAYITSRSAATSIDAGQTWQSFSGSRLVNTNYTNNTGGPIMVYARVGSSGYQNIEITSDGIEVAQATSTNTGGNTGCTAIIPNGAVYRVNVNAGGTTVLAWSELRP